MYTKLIASTDSVPILSNFIWSRYVTSKSYWDQIINIFGTCTRSKVSATLNIPLFSYLIIFHIFIFKIQIVIWISQCDLCINRHIDYALIEITNLNNQYLQMIHLSVLSMISWYQLKQNQIIIVHTNDINHIYLLIMCDF